jgi:hypothetical protein
MANAQRNNPDFRDEPDAKPKLTSIPGGGETSGDRSREHLSLVDNRGGYDDQQPLADASAPKFGLIQGGGESSDDRANLKEAGSGENDSKSVSPNKLKEKEAGGGSESGGNNWAPPSAGQEANALNYHNEQEKPGKQKGKSKGGRAKKAIIGAIVAFVVFGFAGVVIYLPTLAIKTLMSNVRHSFSSRIEFAVASREQKYVDKYISKIIVPSIKLCGTSISKDCTVVAPGTGITGRIFTAWRDNRIEEKLDKVYGITFVKDVQDGNIIQVYKRVGVDGEKVLLGNVGEHKVTSFVTTEMKNITQSGGIRDRWLARSLLVRKYQASKFCFIACAKRDEFGNIKLNAVKKLKIKLIANIVEPRDEKAATYLMCFVLGCGGGDEAVQKKADQAGAKLLSKVDSEGLKRIATDIGDKSLKTYLQKKALQAILKPFIADVAGQAEGQAAADAAETAVPIAGQVYKALVIADLIDQVYQKVANKSISKYAKLLNEEAYSKYYTAWTVIDEDIQSGMAKPEDVGAAVQAMQGFDGSRVYEQMTGGTLTDIKCNDNVMLRGASGALACPEKQVQPSLGLEEFLNGPYGGLISGVVDAYGQCSGIEIAGNCGGVRPRTVVHPILHAISWVNNAVGGLVIEAVSHIPGLGDLMNYLTGKLSEGAAGVLGWFMTKLFPSVINVTAQGPENADQVFAGADVFNNEFAKGAQTSDGFIGLGAQQLTPQQEVALDTTISKQREEQFQSGSFFARYLDPSNEMSVAGKAVNDLAISLPKVVKAPVSFLGIFSSITKTFSSLVTPHAHAVGLTNRKAIFGVTQYGYPVGSAELNVDPDTLTDSVCAQYKKDREDSKMTDPDTKEVIYTKSDPCMLDKTVTDSLTKIFSLDPVTAAPAVGP